MQRYCHLQIPLWSVCIQSQRKWKCQNLNSIKIEVLFLLINDILSLNTLHTSHYVAHQKNQDFKSSISGLPNQQNLIEKHQFWISLDISNVLQSCQQTSPGRFAPVGRSASTCQLATLQATVGIQNFSFLMALCIYY